MNDELKKYEEEIKQFFFKECECCNGTGEVEWAGIDSNGVFLTCECCNGSGKEHDIQKINKQLRKHLDNRIYNDEYEEKKYK